jgi:hypothetical protein
MPVNYTVRADVIDIRSDTPQPNDVFLVDTNVWYWLVYTRASIGPNPPQTRQVTDYPGYITQALAAQAQLRCSGLTMAEMVHLVEKAEREIYGSLHPAPVAKEFRHNFPAERANVITEVVAAWSQIANASTPLDIVIDDAATRAALARFQTEALDGYDLFLVEAMHAAGVTQIITDDGDYCGVAGIRMFTSNRNVLLAAKAQGRLVIR